MQKKVFAVMVAIALMVVLMPTKSTHANIAWGPSDPATPVVIGNLPWKEKIEYRLNFVIGVNVQSLEIAPAGTNVWTQFIKHANGLPYQKHMRALGCEDMDKCHSSFWDIFTQDLYGDIDTFDIRINGTVWKNVKLYNDADIYLAYTAEQGPIVLSSRIKHKNLYW
jgi:hypothetical protein